MNHSPEDPDNTLVFRRSDFDDGLRGEFPEDLRSWQPAVRLIRLVQDEVSVLAQNGALSADARRITAILLWCLATGRYASWDIEALCAEEPLTRHLADGLNPSYQDIHRFRREHEASLTLALARLLNAARPAGAAVEMDTLTAEAARRYERARYADTRPADG